MRRLIRSEKERLEVRRNFRSGKTIRSETTTRREKKCLGVRRIVYEFETRRMRDVRIKVSTHDEVYGCLKGGSGNSGGKRLAISMVEEAWLSEKEEVQINVGVDVDFETSRDVDASVPHHEMMRCHANGKTGWVAHLNPEMGSSYGIT
ncbi:hypothetical protein Tco_0432499 [Tanacetum coccineum]